VARRNKRDAFAYEGRDYVNDEFVDLACVKK
jgi:hypothetical protein